MEPPTERGRRLAALSAQLRELHAQMAGMSVEERREQLRDRVQLEVNMLPPHERESFLTDMMDQFPVWNESPGPAPAAPAPAVTAAAAPKDPLALAELLIASCASLPERDRAVVAGRLAAAGLGGKGEVREVIKEVVREVATAGGLPSQPLTDLKKVLNIPADATIVPERLAELSVLLADFAARMESGVCNLWRRIAPEAKSQVFRVLAKDPPNERQGLMVRFLTGDAALPKDTVAKDISRSLMLTLYLVRAANEVGLWFGADHLSKFRPDEVQRAAGSAGAFEKQETRNWKQYLKMMEGYDEGAIERRIRELIAKNVDSWMMNAATKTTK